MKSKTKNRLPDEKIRELAGIHFGESCEIGEIKELKGGMFNAIYLIERIKEQDQIVLKTGVVPGTTLLTYEQDVMPTEVECYRLIKEQTTVPLPQILAYDFSKKYCDSNYFFMTALEGVSLLKVHRKMSKENLDGIKQELAGYLAQIHGIKGPYFGYFSEKEAYQYKTWKEAFMQMFAQILQDGRAHEVKLPYERIESVLKQNLNCLEDLAEPALVEYDCHEGNIFVKKVGENYRIEGILDFERAFFGDPIADFPAAFILTDDIRKEKVFLDAYLKASGNTQYSEKDVKRYQLYRMYILTIMAAETFRYGFLYAKLQGGWAKKEIAKCLDELA